MLVLSFSNYTSSEIKERLLENFKQDHNKIHQIHFYTLHKLCHEIIRDFGGNLFEEMHDEEEEKKGPNFQIANYEKQLSILKHAVEDYKQSKLQVNQHSHILTSEINEVNSYLDDSTQLNTILNWIHLQKCKNLPPYYFKSPYKDYYLLYEEGLIKEKAIDFSGLFVYAKNIVTAEGSAAAKYLKEKYRYILLDDTQDISVVQFELLKALKSRDIYFSLFGDDDQTISSSKGSFREVFLNFQSALGMSNTTVRLLKNVYRSDGYICSAAQSLISRNLKRQIKKVECTKPLLEKNVLVCTENEEEEVKLVLDLTRAFLAQDVKSIQSQTHFPFKIISTMYSTNPKSAFNVNNSLKTICIIARHFKQLSLLETTLRCNHIPFIKLGAKTLLEREDVLDVVAHIVLASAAEDVLFTTKNHVKLDAYFSRIVNKPKVGLGESCFTYLNRLKKDRKLHNYIDALYYAIKFKFPQADEQDNPLSTSTSMHQLSILKFAQQSKGTTTSARRDTKILSKKEQESLHEFYVRIENIRKKLNTDSLSKAVEYIINDSSYSNYFQNTIHKSQTQEEAMQTIHQLLKEIESLNKFSDTMQHNLQQKLEHFLQYCDVQLFSEEEQGQLDEKIPVVLATVSQVKGMEFDTVILLQFNERNFPFIDTNLLEDGYSKVNRDELIENERKLAYFCMVRAKQKLFLSYLRNSYLKRNMESSRFIKELSMNENCIAFDLSDKEVMDKKRREEKEELQNNSFTRLDQFEDDELDLGNLIEDDEDMLKNQKESKSVATIAPLDKIEFQPTLSQVLKISKRPIIASATPAPSSNTPTLVTEVLNDSPTTSKLQSKEKLKSKPIVKKVIKEESLNLEERKALQNSKTMFQKWLKPNSTEKKEEDATITDKEESEPSKRKPVLIIRPNKSQKLTENSTASSAKQKQKEIEEEEALKRKQKEDCELVLNHVMKHGAQGISFVIGQVCKQCEQSITRQQIMKLQVTEETLKQLKCPNCESDFTPTMQIEIQCVNENGQTVLLQQQSRLLTEMQLRNLIRKDYKLNAQVLDQKPELLSKYPEIFWNILNQHGTLSVDEDKKIKNLFLEPFRKSY